MSSKLFASKVMKKSNTFLYYFYLDIYYLSKIEITTDLDLGFEGLATFSKN